MKNRKLLGSTFIFLGTLLCFFLPFVTVSCQGMNVFTVTGRQLATGATIVQPGGFGSSNKQRISLDPFATIAALSAVSGLILSLVGRRMVRGVATSGAVGTASLAAMKVHLDYELQKQGMGMAQNNYQAGYFLALLLMIAGTGWSFYRLRQREEDAESGIPSSATLHR
jgi:hypothetical protein